jgi:hypothetical protein
MEELVWGFGCLYSKAARAHLMFFLGITRELTISSPVYRLPSLLQLPETPS